MGSPCSSPRTRRARRSSGIALRSMSSRFAILNSIAERLREQFENPERQWTTPRGEAQEPEELFGDAYGRDRRMLRSAD